MSLPTYLVMASTAGASGSITIIVSVISVSVAVMVALIKIFGPSKKISDENLRESEYLKSMYISLKEKEDTLQKLKDLVYTHYTEVEILKTKEVNISKTIDELKNDNKLLIRRLDDFLKQFMEYIKS